MIILGPPASGKTGLALRLAAELSRPVLCKDDVKEALFDVLGSTDREGSRRFSEAALAAVLRMARTQLCAGSCCLIEGNFTRNHAAALREILGASQAGAESLFRPSARTRAAVCRPGPAPGPSRPGRIGR
jgi:predicted kinase